MTKMYCNLEIVIKVTTNLNFEVHLKHVYFKSQNRYTFIGIISCLLAAKNFGNLEKIIEKCGHFDSKVESKSSVGIMVTFPWGEE